MKKSVILMFSILLIISGCNKAKQKNIAQHKLTYSQVDLTNENHDNTIKKTVKEDFLNNKNAKDSPVKIVSSYLSRSQYSSHKDIRLTFKNSGKKNIQAIKFEWYCENSFDEPANGRYFYGEGRSTGEIAYVVKAGKTSSKIWEDFSTDANRIIKARAYYVVFTDGTKWQLK